MLIPSGSKCIDSLLGGGVETGTITQIYGESGTGKTSLCLMLCRSTVKFAKAAYIDTEGLSAERVKQVFGDFELLKNVYIHEVFDFRQQSSAVKKLSKLCKSEEIKLVIVDSFTGLYRSEIEEDRAVKIKRELTKQLTFLLGLARKYDLAVVITNQMFTDVSTGIDRPIGGPSIGHLSKVVLELSMAENGMRKARLIKHRWKAEGEECFYRITDSGINP
ncbi:MAG: DNA repair and recombination protein RadB [Archaeoglobus sp.]|nr:MAG: DNA repair and recombination protein RadB [Archaeoglobus sp.]